MHELIIFTNSKHGVFLTLIHGFFKSYHLDILPFCSYIQILVLFQLFKFKHTYSGCCILNHISSVCKYFGRFFVWQVAFKEQHHVSSYVLWPLDFSNHKCFVFKSDLYFVLLVCKRVNFKCSGFNRRRTFFPEAVF